MANRIPQIDYFPTESEIGQMLASANWQRFFTKDYAALKGNVANTVSAAESNADTLDVLTDRVDAIDLQIVEIIGRLDTAEGEIDTLQTNLADLTDTVDTHIAAESAHGATGNIVGTDDYCTGTVGGVVLLGVAVADATPSAVTPPAAVAAAGAAYVQAYAQSQTDAINALSTAMAQLVIDLNAVTTQLNALLASERTAKQLAP